MWQKCFSKRIGEGEAVHQINRRPVSSSRGSLVQCFPYKNSDRTLTLLAATWIICSSRFPVDNNFWSSSLQQEARIEEFQLQLVTEFGTDLLATLSETSWFDSSLGEVFLVVGLPPEKIHFSSHLEPNRNEKPPPPGNIVFITTTVPPLSRFFSFFLLSHPGMLIRDAPHEPAPGTFIKLIRWMCPRLRALYFQLKHQIV
jgi:hypothetical protein